MTSRIFSKTFSATRFLAGFLVLTSLISMGAQAAPNVTSTQTDSYADANGDGMADPGEQVDYTTVITNSGDMAAEDVEFSNVPPADTTLVAGSVKTTPLARDDLYASVGNVGIAVPDANGVMANDYDLGPVGLSVASPVPGTLAPTVKGGSVVFSAGGGFIYTPPAGFEGVDSFSYTIADESGPILPAPATGANIATVTIPVDGMIWFIDNSGLAGNGSMESPFNSLSQHNTNPNDNDGDCIFVYSGLGIYDGGILLQPGQVLVGEGSSESLADTCAIALPPYSIMLPPTGGTRPALFNSSGDAIYLSSGNTVRGVNVGDTLGAGIYGSGFGTATIHDVAVATSGLGIYLDTGTLDAVFDSVSKLSSPQDGIVLNNVEGMADFGVLSIVSIGLGRGIWLDGTSPANSSFSASGSLASADGTALDCSDCKLGTGAGITFDNVSSDGGSDPGINLRSVAGTLTIMGGTIKNKLDTDGIRLQNTAERISLSNMVIREINGTGDASPVGSPIALDGGPFSHHSGADGIHGEDVLGGLSLDTVTIERVSDNAINGELLTATYSPAFHPTLWNGLLLKDCIFRDSNRYHIGPDQLDDRNSNFIESQVHIHGISGQVTISGCEFTRGAGLLHLVSAHAGNLRADITDNDFSLSQKEMSPSAFAVGGPQTVGGAAIEIYGQGSAVLDVIIGDINETDSALGNSFVNCGAGALGSLRLQSGLSGLVPFNGDFDTVVSRNTFRVTDHFSDANPGSFQGFPQGHLEFLLEGNGVAEAAVSHNALEQLQGPGDGPAAFTFTTGRNMIAELMLNDNTMDKAWNRISSFQAFSGSQQIVKLVNNAYIGDTAFPYTTSDDAGYAGGFLGVLPYEGQVIRANGAGGGFTSIDFTADNEDPPSHDTAFNFFSDRAFDFENFFGGITDIELDNNNPVLGFEFHEASGGSAGTINLYRDASGSTSIGTILAVNGNTGGHTDNSGGFKVLNTTASDPTTDPTIIVP